MMDRFVVFIGTTQEPFDLIHMLIVPLLVLVVTVLIFCICRAIPRRNAVQPNHDRHVQYPSRRVRVPKQLYKNDIGVRFNRWRKPKTFLGPGEEHLPFQLCRNFGLGELDVDQKKWEVATEVVNKVLEMLLHETAKEAAQYKLKLEKFVRQGSAREGLKVCDADEFDVLVPFSIENLRFEVKPELDYSDRTLPEISKLRVVYPPSHRLSMNYPSLDRCESFFTYYNGHVYLNSRKLHEKVFTAIIDRASGKIEGVCRLDGFHPDFSLRIRRAVNPPAVKITLEIIYNSTLDIVKHIDGLHRVYFQNESVTLESRVSRIHLVTDIDIVPALLLQHDRVPDPTEYGTSMDCPRYAVFKWVKENHPFSQIPGVDPATIWRMDSSGYEKHVMDVAQGTTEQRYILTAHRFLKAFCLYEKQQHPPAQFVTVLRSYFLKQVAFYCILYFTILNKVPLTGVRQAFAILLDLIGICLEEKRLPHFFHTNPWLGFMFPDYEQVIDAMRYDVFHTIDSDAMKQARLSLRRDVRPKLEEFVGDLPEGACDIERKFREFVLEGDYM